MGTPQLWYHSSPSRGADAQRASHTRKRSRESCPAHTNFLRWKAPQKELSTTAHGEPVRSEVTPSDAQGWPNEVRVSCVGSQRDSAPTPPTKRSVCKSRLRSGRRGKASRRSKGSAQMARKAHIAYRAWWRP
eukprot:scaffold128682_cov63-Phaeocystis_antarctica.AAC.5